MSQKILVTGAAGFIGFHLSKHLLEEGYEVVVLGLIILTSIMMLILSSIG